MFSIAYGDQPKRGWFGRLEILSFVRRVLYRSPRDWDIARFKVSERRPVIGELRSSSGAVAHRLVDFTLGIGREKSRITSGSPNNPGTISPCDLGTRRLTATTCKACASSPGVQEEPNFGPICPPYGSIIRAWNPCGMASKNLEMNRTLALSSIPFLLWHGPLLQTAPRTSSISAGWTIRVYLQSKLWARDGRLRFIQTTCHEFWRLSFAKIIAGYEINS